ncbi:unnamed protein product [Nippostrongylus brasiliensis]|uniref:HECT-type E3 ubiquitin transferase n=1 Tax=Nippostrongylus brasiliensis TaxID=27835 RepID=A0A0N4YVY7_NIPBR|nr:unnamed protein product [Nippostrongylus brasiliensis]
MDERSRFLADAATQRRERELGRIHEETAVKLQALARGHLTRRKFQHDIRTSVSEKLSSFSDLEKSGKVLLQNSEVLKLARLLLCIKRIPDDNEGAKVSEVKVWQTFVHFLVLMSSCNGWLLVRNAPQVQKVLNDLCNKMCSSLGEPANFSRLANSLFIASNEHKPVLCAQALNALFSTLMKYVKNDDSLLPLFVSQVLTCPAIISHLSQANLDAFLASGLFDRCLTLLRASSDVVDNIEPQRTINLLGNVIHLGYLDEEVCLHGRFHTLRHLYF